MSIFSKPKKEYDDPIEKLVVEHRLFIMVEPITVSTGKKSGHRWTWSIIDLNRVEIIDEDDTLLGELTYPEARDIALSVATKIINQRTGK